MNENDRPLKITAEDIAAANRLSLHCPICAAAVEKYVESRATAPVYCTACETLYHHACWRQNGGKCAILGCENKSFKQYGVIDLGPTLTIEHRDLPRDVPRPVPSPNGRTKRLKLDEQHARQERRGSFWRGLWQGLLRAIRLWPSDPS